MQCKLANAKHQIWPGQTLVTTSVSGGMLPAAVYVPPNHDGFATMLNVLLFLHGFYVPSVEALTNSDNTRVCEQVLSSGKDVILVAPWLGSKWGKGVENGVLQTDLFAQATYGQRFLRAILDALPASSTPAVAALPSIPGVDAISGAGPFIPRSFGIKNLVVACHSGGGVAMRYGVRTLGAFERRLRECIGLDCLYNDGDAQFWFDRAKEPGASPAYFHFGPSTIPESIKLYLMARGRADALGNQRNPAGPVQGNLVVRPGHVSSFMYGGVTTNVSGYIDRVVDDLIARGQPASAAPARSATARDGEFVKQAAANFEAGYIFPVNEKDARGGIHYFIARAFLLDRLKNVALT
jgi:hypothetical protein